MRLPRDFGVHVFADNVDAADGASAWVLAVKPQVMRAVCEGTGRRWRRRTRPLVVSIAAGITAAQLRRWLGGDLAVVRDDAEHPGPAGRGRHRPVRQRSASTRAARAARERCCDAAGHDRVDRRRSADGRGDRRVRQRPGLCVPAGRSDAGRGRSRGPCDRTRHAPLVQQTILGAATHADRERTSRRRSCAAA